MMQFLSAVIQTVISLIDIGDDVPVRYRQGGYDGIR